MSDDSNRVKALELAIRKALAELDMGRSLVACGILEASLETPGTIGHMHAQRLIAAGQRVTADNDTCGPGCTRDHRPAKKEQI